jgi:hypothetical protein
MNLKSTICCTLLFLHSVDATNRHLRGRGRRPALSWSVIKIPQDPDFGINTIPESFAPGEPNPGKPSCAIGNRGIVACPPIFAPVLCGDEKCQYDNLCSAQAGPGFTKEDCEPVDLAVDAQCAKSCPEIFSPVSCDDCIYDNICFAKAAGFLRDCKPATNVQGQGQGQGQVHNMPVPEDTLPGNPPVIDTVVVQNMPVPGYTLPGSPPVVDTVVIHDMPVPDDTLPVNPSEPIEEPATGMGPSTIAIGESNPATPNPDDPGMTTAGSPPVTLSAKESEPLEEPATDMRPSTIAIGEPNPAIPIPDTPGMIVPGKPSVSIFSGSEEDTSAYPETPGRIRKPSVSVMSGTEEATSDYRDTPVMIIPGSPSVSVLVADEETSSGTSSASWCRETRSNAICDEVVDPVRCGPANCTYGNLCLGIGAGFLETDCGSAR